MSGQATGPSARPNLEGIWNSGTATPLERPKELGNKAFFSPQEAAEWEREIAKRNEEPPPGAPRGGGTGTYNTFYREFGTRTVKTLRTSIVTHPPDGRIPPLTPAGKERAARAIPQSGLQAFSIVGSWLDRGIWERCITRGVPDVMLPTAYNNNYRIFQTKDTVAILEDGPQILTRPPAGVAIWTGPAAGG